MEQRIGAATLVQSWGVGPIRSNTVVLNWMEDTAQGTSAELWYGRLLGAAHLSGTSESRLTRRTASVLSATQPTQIRRNIRR